MWMVGEMMERGRREEQWQKFPEFYRIRNFVRSTLDSATGPRHWSLCRAKLIQFSDFCFSSLKPILIFLFLLQLDPEFLCFAWTGVDKNCVYICHLCRWCSVPVRSFQAASCSGHETGNWGAGQVQCCTWESENCRGFCSEPFVASSGYGRHSAIPRSARTVYLYVLCGSENKQRLFPYTALTDWFV